MIRFICLLSLLLLTACGFTPVYGTQGTADETTMFEGLTQVDIAIIPNREGQFLRNALIDRFYKNGAPDAPRYILRVNPIGEQTYNFDITIESEATRRQLRLNTKMSLVDTQSKKTVLTRNLLSIASYNVLQSEFSTIVTEQAARDDALNDLARQIELQIKLYLK